MLVLVPRRDTESVSLLPLEDLTINDGVAAAFYDVVDG